MATSDWSDFLCVTNLQSRAWSSLQNLAKVSKSGKQDDQHP